MSPLVASSYRWTHSRVWDIPAWIGRANWLNKLVTNMTVKDLRPISIVDNSGFKRVDGFCWTRLHYASPELLHETDSEIQQSFSDLKKTYWVNSSSRPRQSHWRQIFGGPVLWINHICQLELTILMPTGSYNTGYYHVILSMVDTQATTYADGFTKQLKNSPWKWAK